MHIGSILVNGLQAWMVLVLFPIDSTWRVLFPTLPIGLFFRGFLKKCSPQKQMIQYFFTYRTPVEKHAGRSGWWESSLVYFLKLLGSLIINISRSLL